MFEEEWLVLEKVLRGRSLNHSCLLFLFKSVFCAYDNNFVTKHNQSEILKQGWWFVCDPHFIFEKFIKMLLVERYHQ